jgi:hypothetical protein
MVSRSFAGFLGVVFRVREALGIVLSPPVRGTIPTQVADLNPLFEKILCVAGLSKL